MGIYRAKRNTAMASGVWRQGTDREIDDDQLEYWAPEIASGQIVEVGPALIEELRPARTAEGTGEPMEAVEGTVDGPEVEITGDGSGRALPPADDDDGDSELEGGGAAPVDGSAPAPVTNEDDE